MYLLKQQNPSARNARWLAILSEYRISTIKHLPGIKNIVPDMLSRLVDDNIKTRLISGLPWAVNNNIVTMVTRSTSPSSQRTPANQTSPSGSQRLQTANQEPSVGKETHVMASNDVIDLQHKQGKYKPFSDIISYLQGKACKVPKNLGIDISRFTLNEEILCISSLNAYDKLYTRICIPPNLVQNTLKKAHINTGHGGIRRMTEHLKKFAWW